MDAPRPSTPPPIREVAVIPSASRPPLTPEQVRRIEINRLRAKAIREQYETAGRAASGSDTSRQSRNSTTSIAGQKRPHGGLSSFNIPSTSRDGRATHSGSLRRPHDDIQAAQKFNKFVEYDFSKMTDTKGGFLTQEDDPHNKALYAPSTEDKPAAMSLQEWERQQLLRSLRKQKTGPFEPGINAMKEETSKECEQCGSLEIDFTWDEVFGCRVCNTCKEKLPERYSLLTKTEAREDYLLTDPELKDEELLPHLERPNPHKSSWNNMMLYLRCQVEDHAFSAKKWGSAEGLDAEFVKRETDKKKRKEDKFKAKLRDLKKRTRVEAHRRERERRGGDGGQFGDVIGKSGRHEHEWGRTIENPETGIGVKTCIECGMEIEELEF